MSALRKNVAGQHIGFCLNSTAAGTPVTAGGAGTIVIDGGAQAACAGTFTHKGTGQWDYAPTQAETNGTSICFAFTGTGAIQVGMQFFTINYDTTATAVPVTSNIKKNSSSRLTFTMTDSTNHNPKTGLTVAGQVSIDGGAFANLINTPATEIASGDYTIALAAADTNGNTLMFRFTATAADDLNIMAITQP